MALERLWSEIEASAHVSVPFFERGDAVAAWRAVRPRDDAEGDAETVVASASAAAAPQVSGSGAVAPASATALMVVFDFVKRSDVELVERVLVRNGVDTVHDAHFTYLFKAIASVERQSRGGGAPRVTRASLEKATRLLAKEFAVVRPRVVLCVGRYSATAVVAAHLDVARVRGGAAAWRAFERSPAPSSDAADAKWDTDYETSVRRRRIDACARAYRDQMLFGDDRAGASHGAGAPRPDDWGAGWRGAATASAHDTPSLVPLQRIEGVAQRVYACGHVCWAIATTSPNFATGGGGGGGGGRFSAAMASTEKAERVSKWLANFESVKAYTLRGPPIVAAQIDDKVRAEFEASGVAPDTYECVAQRFAGSNYTKLRRELACKVLRGGAERVEFQVVNIGYDEQLNEFALYGRLDSGHSVYCTVPHARGERIFHFYTSYPKCWRAGGTGTTAAPLYRDAAHPQFGHEKDYAEQTRDHGAVLAAKSAELRRRLRAKLVETGCRVYTEALVRANTARSTRRLCELDAMAAGAAAATGPGGGTAGKQTSRNGGADGTADLLAEVCDVELRRSFKYEFRSYDTQEKPRVRVDVRYAPVLPWIVECLRDMVNDDSAAEAASAEPAAAAANARRGVPQHIKFYELDMTPVQRLTLHNNIYVGGWVCIDAHRYEIVSGSRSIDERIGVVRLKRGGASPLGAKKSTCDLEIVAFRAHITGHNPNEHVELQLRRDELAEQRADTAAQVERWQQRWRARTPSAATAATTPAITVGAGAACGAVAAAGAGAGAADVASAKYAEWLRVQTRRLRSMDAELRRVDDKMRGGVAGAEPVALRRWARNAPTRVLCWDIECMTDGKSFPDAKHCPVISIVAYVQTLDGETRVDRKTGIAAPWHEVAWFCLGPVDKAAARAERCDDAEAVRDSGAVRTFNVYCFASERELLRAFLLFRCDRDADIDVGHNSDRFDHPYLSQRCELSGAYDTPLLACMYGTRRLFERVRVRTTRTFSKAFGAKEQTMVRMAGCSCLDTMTVFQREEKLSAYSLNALATLKFGANKVDLPYVAIPGAFWRARRRLLFYNDRDTNLTLRLLLNKNTVVSSIEFIKLAGVFSQQDSYARGQQFKVLNCIYRSIENDGAHYVVQSGAETVERLLQRVERDRERLRGQGGCNNGGGGDDNSDSDGNEYQRYSDSDDGCAASSSDSSSSSSDSGSDGRQGARRRTGRQRRNVRIEYDNNSKKGRGTRDGRGRGRLAKAGGSLADAVSSADESEMAAMSTPDTSDGERAEWERDEKARREQARTQGVVDTASFAAYIDDTVSDATAAANRPFVFKTSAQRRDEAARRAAGFAGVRKKPSAKERDAHARAVSNTPNIGDLLAGAAGGGGGGGGGGSAAGGAVQRLRDPARSRAKKLRRLRKLRAAAAAATEADGEVQYKGATCIEPRRGFHIYKQGESGEWRAVFVLCCDFSSLYPTVDIANNFCHDKKLTRRKLNKLRVPLELCRASTEAWPDERDGGALSYAYFVQADYEPALLGRCRERANAASLLRLLELTWPNERWRHITTAYWRVLAHWGVDVSHVVGAAAAAAGPPPFEPMRNDYVPDIARTEEYVPDAARQAPAAADADGACADAAHSHELAELDEILLRYWEDDEPGGGADADASAAAAAAAVVVRRDTVRYPSRGILPKYLSLCLMARKQVKRAMKGAAYGSAEYKSMDGAQLALKVTANSGYGVTGLDSRTAKLGDYSISASITGYGRRYLAFVKNFFVRGTGDTFTFDYERELGNEGEGGGGGGGGAAAAATRRRVACSEAFVFRGGENYGGDTDSFFNSLHGVDYAMVERMGEKTFTRHMQTLCDLANAQLPAPVELLFEKIMCPFMSVNKKRYVYVDFARDKICFKGLELARRDNCQFLRDMQAEVFERLLLRLDIDGAVAHVREQCQLLLEGRVDLMRLIVTKQYYRATYKTETLPHLIVIKKRAHRGEPPVEIGERVPYIIVKGTSDVRNSSLNAEDPTYVLEHDLAIDYEYYLDKQVRKPMLRVFSRVPGIDSERRADRLLFANLTRRKFAATLQPAHAMHRHVRRVHECVVCAAPSYQLCCERCFGERRADADAALRAAAAGAEREWRARIDTCKRCLHQRAGDYAEPVACENTTCAEYAPRKRAVADRTKATARLRDYAAMCAAPPASLDW